MYFIATVGALWAYFCLCMIISPARFAQGIVAFSQHRLFHPFEVISRLLAGALFFYFADTTPAPWLIKAVGVGLILVGLGLIWLRSPRHKQFAVWSAQRFKTSFRLIGAVCLPIAIVFVLWMLNLLP